MAESHRECVDTALAIAISARRVVVPQTYQIRFVERDPDVGIAEGLTFDELVKAQ